MSEKLQDLGKNNTVVIEEKDQSLHPRIYISGSHNVIRIGNNIRLHDAKIFIYGNRK